MVETEGINNEHPSYTRTVESMVGNLKLADVKLEIENAENAKKIIKSLMNDIPVICTLFEKLIQSFKNKLLRTYQILEFDSSQNDFLKELENKQQNKLREINNLKDKCKCIESDIDNQIISLKNIQGDINEETIKQVEEFRERRKDVENIRGEIEEYREKYGKEYYKESLYDLSEEVIVLRLKKNIIENDMESLKAKFIVDLINSKQKLLRKQMTSKYKIVQYDPEDEDRKEMGKLTELKATYSREKGSFLNKVYTKIKDLKREVVSTEEKRKKELAEAKKYLESARRQKETIYNEVLMRLDKMYINNDEFNISRVNSLDDLSRLEEAEGKYKETLNFVNEQKNEIENLIAVNKSTIDELAKCGIKMLQADFHSQIDIEKHSLENLIEDKRKKLEETLNKTRREQQNIIEGIMANPTEKELQKVKAELEEIPQAFDDDCKIITMNIVSRKATLESSVAKIKQMLYNQLIVNGTCLVCAYGKTGRVELSCGHYRCLQCVTENRIKYPEDITISCNVCKQVHNIGKLF